MEHHVKVTDHKFRSEKAKEQISYKDVHFSEKLPFTKRREKIGQVKSLSAYKKTMTLFRKAKKLAEFSSVPVLLFVGTHVGKGKCYVDKESDMRSGGTVYQEIGDMVQKVWRESDHCSQSTAMIPVEEMRRGGEGECMFDETEEEMDLEAIEYFFSSERKSREKEEERSRENINIAIERYFGKKRRLQESWKRSKRGKTIS